MLIEKKKSLKGEIAVPGDKSISHRAVIFGALSTGITEIDNFLMSEDCLSTIDCFRKMQVGIEILPDSKIRISGKGLFGLKAPSGVLNAGRGGTTVRLLLGILAGQPFNSTITRDESVLKKPIGRVTIPLRLMGAKIAGKDDGNLCPLHISPSCLQGITYGLSVWEAYAKSPVILAGLYAYDDTTVIENIKSRDHTELMLKYFGGNIDINGLSVTVRRLENLYARHVEVPGDISKAAYFLAAGLLVPNSELTIRDVGVNPTRTGVIDVLKSMGAKIELSNEHMHGNEKVADITVSSSTLRAASISEDMAPGLIDEMPIIAVAACMASGTTVISGLKGFKVKESGRIKRLATELTKMGASVHETEDGMIIEGGKPLRGTIIESYNDYAIAMSMSVAGMVAEGETMIRKSPVIDAVFPQFFSSVSKLQN